jgi:hypothetical protein
MRPSCFCLGPSPESRIPTRDRGPGVEHGKLEAAEPRRISDRLDVGDPAIRDHQAEHQAQVSSRRDDNAQGPVDQRGSREGGPAQGRLRHRPGAAQVRGNAAPHRCCIGAKDDIRIKQRKKGRKHGGNETTLFSIIANLLHFGMTIVGLPYSHAGQMRIDEVVGGAPYGATTIAGGDGSRKPSQAELDGARHQGALIAMTAAKLFG